jgi:hypothetical protein
VNVVRLHLPPAARPSPPQRAPQAGRIPARRTAGAPLAPSPLLPPARAVPATRAFLPAAPRRPRSSTPGRGASSRPLGPEDVGGRGGWTEEEEEEVGGGGRRRKRGEGGGPRADDRPPRLPPHEIGYFCCFPGGGVRVSLSVCQLSSHLVVSVPVRNSICIQIYCWLAVQCFRN